MEFRNVGSRRCDCVVENTVVKTTGNVVVNTVLTAGRFVGVVKTVVSVVMKVVDVIVMCLVVADSVIVNGTLVTTAGALLGTIVVGWTIGAVGSTGAEVGQKVTDSVVGFGPHTVHTVSVTINPAGRWVGCTGAHDVAQCSVTV